LVLTTRPSQIIAISDYEKLNDVVSSIDKLKLVRSEFER